MQAERIRKIDQQMEYIEKPKYEYVTKSKWVNLRFNELLIYACLIIMVALSAYFFLHTKQEAHAHQATQAQLTNEISFREKEIDELTTEVTHLSSYDRIYEKANQLGLKMENGNVKVVKKYEKKYEKKNE